MTTVLARIYSTGQALFFFSPDKTSCIVILKSFVKLLVKFCEIFHNNFFKERSLAAASERILIKLKASGDALFKSSPQILRKTHKKTLKIEFFFCKFEDLGCKKEKKTVEVSVFLWIFQNFTNILKVQSCKLKKH